MIVLLRWLLPAAACLTALAGLACVAWHRAALAGRAPHPRTVRLARGAWYVQAGLVQVAAAALVQGLVTNRFALDYVYRHSSTDLPLGYRLAALWAGQEGTVLLWAVVSAWLGLALLLTARDWEPTVLAVWSALHLLLLGLLLVRSPLAPVSVAGGPPRDGLGLNPLLQNPWMASHPPLLFAGFAMLGVPFAYAAAGLLRGDPDGWGPRAQGWLLLAWSLLGGGLLLGGYWAYETLGWGGFWGWDPVENSSLVPWLLAGALLHGLVLQPTGGALRRGNMLLAGLTYAAVTGGSYLNRSGVLSDLSVHSFVALSPAFNRALAVFALAPPVGFAGLYLSRHRGLGSGPVSGHLLSRRRLLHLATLLLAAAGGTILLGNAWPLVARLGGATTAVQPVFYNTIFTPLALVLAGLLALAAGADRETPVAALRGPLLIAAVAGGGLAVALPAWALRAAADPDQVPVTAVSLAWLWGLLLALCAGAAAATSAVLRAAWRSEQRLAVGAPLAHLGLLVLIVGVIGSGVYERRMMLSLPRDQAVAFAGYELIYRGLRPAGRGAVVVVEARRGRQASLLTPRLRPGARAGEVLRSPGLRRTWTHDLYLEPGEVRPAEDAVEVILDRRRPARVGDLTVAFEAFDLGGHRPTVEDLRVGVGLRVTRARITTAVKPWFRVRGDEVVPQPAALPGGGTVAVLDLPVQPDGRDRAIRLRFEGLGGARAETLVVQAALKPVASLVWAGGLLLGLGGLLAALRRATAQRGRVS